MPVYNKLVRDRIPEIIEKSGRKAKTSILYEDEYYKELVNKLSEEVNEFIESDNLEEIADIMEVLDTLLNVKGIDWEKVKEIQDEKRQKRGAFKKKIYLIEVED